jgi:hypothetical protein
VGLGEEEDTNIIIKMLKKNLKRPSLLVLVRVCVANCIIHGVYYEMTHIIRPIEKRLFFM